MFNYFKLLNLFRENRVAWKGGGVRAGAVVQQPSQTQRTGEEAQPGGGKESEEEKTRRGMEKEVGKKTKADLAETKHDVERKVTITEIKEAIANVKDSLQRLDLNKAREDNEVDPTTFDISNEVGLKRVCDTFVQLGLSEVHVKWMEENLKLAFSQEILKKPNPADATLLQNPELVGNDAKIAQLYPVFHQAYLYYKTVKETLIEQRNFQVTGIDNRRKMNEDPIFNKAVTHLQSAYDRLAVAVENRDYATMGMYAAGFYAMYKVWGRIAASKTGGSIKTALIWGTAIYCGTHILAPDVAKKIFGGGTSTDIKGTALENLKNNMGDVGFKSMQEMTTAALIAPAHVKDLYEPLTADPKSSQYEMIQLTNPGIQRCFPELASVGPLYPDSKKHFTAEENLYMETAKILYRNARGLETAWQKNVQPRAKVSFKDRFLSDNAADYTIEQVYDALTPYAANYRERFWDASLTNEARKDLSGVFKDSDALHIPVSGSGNNLFGNFMGFPVVIRRNDNAATDKREYRIALASDPEKVVVTIDAEAEKLAKESDSSYKSPAAEELRTAVKERMDELIGRVSISNDTASKSVHYVNGHWEATQIAIAGNEEFDVAAHEESITVTPFPDGRGVQFKMLGSRFTAVVDEKLAENYQISIPILMDLMQQKEFKPLNIFYKQKTVEFEDPRTGDHKFILKIAGIPLEFTYNKGEKDKDKKYSLDNPEKVSDLIKTQEFQDSYVEARGASEEFKVFDEMKKYVSYMPENYFLYFWEGLGHWFTDASYDAPFSGLSTDFLSGSLPDYYTEILIKSKKEQMLNVLRSKLADCKTFSDINEAEKDVEDRLQWVRSYSKEVLEKSAPKSGKTWGRKELMTEILEPLKDAGLRSMRYKNNFKRFETVIFREFSSKGSDLSSTTHEVASRVLATYSYYTAPLDEKSFDNVNGDGTLPEDVRKKDLYMREVESTIELKLKEFLSDGGRPENIPSPQNPLWGIKSYKVWAKENPDALPLDPMEEGKKWEHNPNTKYDPDNLSPLEAVLSNAYFDVFEEIIKDPEANSANLQAFMDRYYEKRANGTSQLRIDTDRICSYARTLKEQKSAITSYARRFRYYLLDPSNERKFWINMNWKDRRDKYWNDFKNMF